MIDAITLNMPGTIEFGVGKIATLKDHLRQSRRLFFLVDTPVIQTIEPIIEELKKSGAAVEISTEVVPEPPIESLEKLLAPVKAFAPDAVVGMRSDRPWTWRNWWRCCFRRSRKRTR